MIPILWFAALAWMFVPASESDLPKYDGQKPYAQIVIRKNQITVTYE